MEQAKQEKLELKRAKESLWKLRNTENKMEQTQEILEINKLEKKHEIMEQVLEKYKKELMEQEENIRKQTNNINNPKQTKNKTKKQENYDKKKKLGEIWTTYRWITEYLEENNSKWRQELEEYFKNKTKQQETWDKLTRQEKIQTIQENNKQEEGKTKTSIWSDKQEETTRILQSPKLQPSLPSCNLLRISSPQE